MAPVTEGHSVRADWGLPNLGTWGAIADDTFSWWGLDDFVEKQKDSDASLITV